MIPVLDADQLEKTKFYVFRQGRLLDRQLYDYFFGHGSREACLKALFAYQNTDGGFGNAIEPDISTPESSGIGAETALYTLDLLDCHEEKYISGLVQWVNSNMNEEGYLNHPPKSLLDYPHQPWWEAPDKVRIFALAGILYHWEYQDSALFEKVSSFAHHYVQPEGDLYYSYPYLVYLKYCRGEDSESKLFSSWQARLPAMLSEWSNFFPLFNRLWYHASDLVESSLVDQAALDVANAMEEDGGLRNPYPDFPWWRPICTVDSLVLLKKRGYL